jgi:hypothetical protein
MLTIEHIIRLNELFGNILIGSNSGKDFPCKKENEKKTLLMEDEQLLKAETFFPSHFQYCPHAA